MLAAQIGMCASTALIAVFAVEGWMTPPLVLGMIFLLNCGIAFHIPGWHASVGDLVPRRHIAGAVSLNAMMFNAARTTGPAIGGLVVVAGGAALTFLLIAVSNLTLIFVLLRWRPAFNPRERVTESLLAAIGVGARYGLMSRDVRAVLVRGFAFAFGSIATVALAPLLARDLLRGDAFVYGMLLGAFGGGGVLAGLLSGKVRVRFSDQVISLYSSAAFVVAAVGAGLSHSLTLTMAALVLGGMGWLLGHGTFNVSLQMLTPRWVVARGLSLHHMALFAGMARGSWCWGVLAAKQGLTTALLGASGMMACGMILGTWFPLRPTRDADDAAGL